MIIGIGIDLVYIPEMSHILETADAFEENTFSEGERKEASAANSKAEYYASVFAVKEAVFKAVASHTKEKIFDFRIVETKHAEDGSPHIVIGAELQKLLDEAGITDLHLSISHEQDYAIAFVIAERRE